MSDLAVVELKHRHIISADRGMQNSCQTRLLLLLVLLLLLQVCVHTLLLQMHASGPALTNMDWLSFFASMISTSTMQGHRFRYSKS